VLRALLFGLTLLAAGAARAHAPGDAPHQRYEMGDLALESGEVIREFAISYVTHGTLNESRSNAVLMVTALGGNHHRLDFLIGPGRALDTAKYFVICTDAIGNGLTTSPSNSRSQPRMSFPRFTVRDMVRSQYRLLTEKLGISRVVSVVGASMGGMQALQWGVSHPDMMDSLVALVPLGRTPAWSTGMSELRRQAIMLDPTWNAGNYTTPPQQGMRLWAGMAAVLVRTPEALKQQFPANRGIVSWLAEAEESGWRRMDANDWIYQSWAYDVHDLGTTSGFGGDYYRALKSIKAKTLIMAGTGDLINPETEALEAAQYIADARYVRIDPELALGHSSAMGVTAPEVKRIDSEIKRFLESVTAR